MGRSGNTKRQRAFLMFGAVVGLLCCAAVVVVIVMCCRSGNGGPTGATPFQAPTVENMCQLLTDIVNGGAVQVSSRTRVRSLRVVPVEKAVRNLLRFANGNAYTETLKAKLKEVAEAVQKHDD